MAQAFTPSRGAIPVLFAHHPDAELWREETTIVPDGPYTATVTPDPGNEGRMLLVASPEDADSGLTPATVTCERGGMPGTAAFVWSTDDGATTWGWNPPMTTERHLDVLVNGLADVGGFDLIEAADGTLVCVVATTALAGTGTLVTCYARPKTGEYREWDARGFAMDPVSTPATYYPTNYGVSPCLVREADGTLYLLVQRHQPAGAGNIQTRLDVYRSKPTADWSGGTGTLWETWAPDAAALGEDVYRAHAVGGAMRAASANGQTLLLLRREAGGDSPDFSQYASHDGLSSFEHISDPELAWGFSLPTNLFDLTSCAGFFVIAFLAYQNDGSGDYTRVKVRRLGSAFDTIDFAEAVDVGLGDDVAIVDGHPPRLSADEDGVLRLFVDTANGTVMLTSMDAGKSWEEGYVLVSPHDTPARWCAAVAWRGRQVLAITTEDYADAPGSLVSLDLGGYTTSAQPREPSGDLSGGTGRLPWSGEIVAVSQATWPTWLDVIGIGTPTFTTLAGPLGSRAVCGVGDQAAIAVQGAVWNPSFTPSVRRVRVYANVNTGAGQVVCASSSRGLRANWTASTITVKDDVSGTTLATISITTPSLGTPIVGLILELDEVSGDGRALYNDRPWLDSSPWEERVAFTSLTSGVASNKGGLYLDAGDSVDCHGFAYACHEPAYNFAPEVPYGRPIGGMPVRLADETFVRCYDGPAVVGDEWAIDKWSAYDAEVAAATIDYPSPRDRVASSGSTNLAWGDWNEAIAYRFSSTARDLGHRLWGVLVQGFGLARLDWHDGTTWQTGPVIHDIEAGSWSAAGDVAVADATGTPEFVQEDELVGGFLVDSTANGGLGVSIEIVGNTAGCIRQPASGEAKLARIKLASSGAGLAFDGLLYPRSVAVLDSDDVPASAKGFRLSIGYFPPVSPFIDLKLAAGPAIALGLPHGRNGVQAFSAPRAEDRTADGRRWAVDPVAPPETTYRVSWQDMPDPHVRQTRRTTAPDYVVDSQGEPIYARGESISTLRAWAVEARRSGRPVVIVPRWVPADGSVVHRRLRAMGALLGTVESEWMDEHAGSGDEYDRDTRRGGELEIRELT